MYKRLTKTVRDRGELLRPDELRSRITDKKKDWYYSPFTYGEDALEYFEDNDRSIKGYKGDVWTDVLYWDLDCEFDFEKVRNGAISLLIKLEELNLDEAALVYFSGNKGIHILLHTNNKFTPKQTSAICYNLAMESGVPAEIFDTSVYNVNRIFRVENTRHQKSKLYKVHLTDEELLHMPEEGVRKLAKKPRTLEGTIPMLDASELLKYCDKPKKENVVSLTSLEGGRFDDFDPMNCPRGKRRCIYVLENGYFEPGKRHEAILRMAAYYKAKGMDYDQAYVIIAKALERRAVIYPDINSPEESETHRDVGVVYSDEWKGGMFTCKTDILLQSKCDMGSGPCSLEEAPVVSSSVVDIEELFHKYVEYGNEALKEYPKTGIDWLDKKLRVRPRNFSIINGANGSGKTSVMINIVEHLNQQNIHNMIFSLDMADTSLFEKIGAMYTDYSQTQIEKAFNVHTRNEEIMLKVGRTLKEKLPYTLFDFTSAADSRHLESAVLKQKRDKGIDIRVAFVDYAGRLIGDHDKEYANSSQNALMANDIVKRTDTHFFYLSQIARDNGDHTSPLRSSRIAKHSGAWEENATFILNVWRPFGDGLESLDNYMHIYIAKNRSGELGERVFWWEGSTGSIREITQKEFGEYRSYCQAEEKPEPLDQFPGLQPGNGDGLRKQFNLDKEEPSDEEEVQDNSKGSRFN